MEGWPLVGRDRERQLLRTLIGRREGAVIVGPPGVGKTMLARACAAEAEAAGKTLVHVAATSASRALPLGAFAPLLPADLEGWEGNDVGLLRRCAEAVVNRPDGPDVLLLVDDAQDLDSSSATLVLQLAQTRAATVLVTIRSGVAAPDSIVALWKDDLLERVDLELLRPEQTADVLAEALGSAIDPATVLQFVERSAGNPLFLRELVLGALDTEQLHRRTGVWRLDGDLQPSSRLIEIVEQRLGRLESGEAELLELVALHEPVGSAELAAFSADATVESLERKGVVSSRLDGRRLHVVLAHPMYGEVARSRLSPLRERDIARRWADVVEGVGARRREDALLLASCRLASGGGNAAVFEAGARVARGRNDPSLTWRFAVAAVDAGAGFDARLLAAEAAFLRGDAEGATRQLSAAAPLARTDEEIARAAALRADVDLFLNGHADPSVIEAAEAVITDPFWREELLSRRVGMLWTTAGAIAAEAAVEPLLASAEPVRASFTHLMGAMMLLFRGRYADATALCDRTAESLGGATTAGPWYEGTRLNITSSVLAENGRLAEARALAERGYQEALETGNVELRAFAAGALARVRLHEGRVGDALVLATDAAETFAFVGRAILARVPYTMAATAAALAGDVDTAVQALDTLCRLDGPPQVDDSDVTTARAWIAVARGDTLAARALFEDAAATATRTGNRTAALAAWHGAARLGAASRADAHVHELAREVDGELAGAIVAHVHALAGRDGHALDQVATAFERLDELLLAAEAAGDAAAVHAHEGQARKAAAAQTRAAELLRTCQGARTPAVVDVEPHPRLSPGELDAARLAATGQANKEIAAALHISVRTVENRLQRAYEKLGVAGRQELAAALERLDR